MYSLTQDKYLSISDKISIPSKIWQGDRSNIKGIYFYIGKEKWDFRSYLNLHNKALNIATSFHTNIKNINAENIAVLVGNTSPALISTFLGLSYAGYCPIIIPSMLPLERIDKILSRLKIVIDTYLPNLVFTDTPSILEHLSASTSIPVHELAEDYEYVETGIMNRNSLKLENISYIQLTSGTTGFSKGVKVNEIALMNNVEVITRWLDWNEKTVTASWLPMNHDMGLVGCFFSSVIHQTDLYLMKPEHFIRDPLVYLRLFDKGVANFSASSPFGLEYILKKISASQLVGMNFSKWRALVIGAERIADDTLTRFEYLMQPFGFSRTCLCPSYGLAEATLAVTGSSPDEAWKTKGFSESNDILKKKYSEKNDLMFYKIVSCGTPLVSNDVTIAGDDGFEVPNGQIGEIVVTSNSLSPYFNSTTDVTKIYRGDKLFTGDQGFLLAGQLYVIGRAGDGIKMRGVWLFPEEIEYLLQDYMPLLAGKFVILLGHSGEFPMVVCLLAKKLEAVADACFGKIKIMCPDLKIFLFFIPSNYILRTTSGKLKRKSMWDKFVGGEYGLFKWVKYSDNNTLIT